MVSISKEKLASLSRSLPMAARSSSKSEASTGKRPQNTTGCAGRKSGSGVGGGLAVVGDGIADIGFGDFLDRGGEDAELAGAEFLDFDQLGRVDGDAIELIDGARGHHADALALLHHAIDDAHEHDDAEIGIVPAIDQQRLERGS